MTTIDTAWALAVALGIGLLLGLERERRKGRGLGRGSAGVRTFALVALLGGLAVATGNDALVAAAAAFVGAIAVISYAFGSHEDPGVTSEVALVVAFVLGGLAQTEPALAGGFGVVVTTLLASRNQLHRLVRDVMSEQELQDLLLFTAAVLVVFPLLPDRRIGPFDGLNLRSVWRLVVVVMAAGGGGYVALRLLGPRFGLPLTGLAGGFVSSAATIASMGSLAKRDPLLRTGAVAGAVLSSVATIVQLAVVLGTSNWSLLVQVAPALASAAIVAVVFAAVAMWRLREPQPLTPSLGPRRAFDLKAAVIFAAMISLVTLLSSALDEWIGTGAAPLTAGLAGFADAHAAAAAMAALVSAGKVEPSMGATAVLLGVTTNTLTKGVAAFASGGRAFAAPVSAGLAALLVAAWLGLALGQLSGFG